MPLRPAPKPTRRSAPGAKREWLKEAYRKLVRPAYLAGLAAGQRRATPVCERCLAGPASEIHHKAGRRGGMLLKFATFAGLCRECHQHVHANPAAAYRDGWLLRSGLDGLQDAEDAAAQEAAARPEGEE